MAMEVLVVKLPKASILTNAKVSPSLSCPALSPSSTSTSFSSPVPETTVSDS